ncbi:MAG: acyl-CoA thioesterase [Paludibacterium sp.]|uniref:acyl-CoA thioesterase n=1 Tax=Paludibacterium sp. TaxID=1917523 RepID=UPI0025E48EDA|nr:thioesterase family protein [Paludibacterium sp.]MBV8046001.1 acyl-CoA thioesterase [Paludibacterium sp.]MBV8648570.1 acyl-CoA thioesterase [Paludibacterium sp.]
MPHTTRIKVRGYHLDLYSHVNNARYLEFLEEARWTLFEERTDLPRYMASGIALIVVNINIDYRYPATMGDELIIESSVKSISNRSAVIHQRVLLAGKDTVVAQADVTMVAFDSQAGRAVPIAGELKSVLESMQEPVAAV